MNQRKSEISKGADMALIIIYFALLAIGLTAIFGVTYKAGDPVLQSFIGFKTDYSKQFYFALVALVLGLFILLTDSKFFPATANLWYAAGIFMLLLVFPLFAHSLMRFKQCCFFKLRYSPAIYFFHQRHCDFQSAIPSECGSHVLHYSSFFHGLLFSGLNFIFSFSFNFSTLLNFS